MLKIGEYFSIKPIEYEIKIYCFNCKTLNIFRSDDIYKIFKCKNCGNELYFERGENEN